MISVSTVSATDNLGNQTLDDSNGAIIKNMETKTFDDLQTLVNQKNEFDELLITDDYNAYSNELLIDKSITISGVGNNTLKYSKINISTGDVVMKNLVLSDCKAYASNSKLTLINCKIIGSGHQSGCSIRGENLEIINSTFLNFCNPICDSKNVIITNSTFKSDRYESYHMYNITSLKIFNSKFENLPNLKINPLEAEVSNSTFSQNRNMELQSKNANISNCKFIDNVQSDEYSILVSLYGNATLYRNTFINNSYIRAVRFDPQKNVVSNFNMTNNIFISQYNEQTYYTPNIFKPLTFSTTYIIPSTKTIHVIPQYEDFDDYFYDKTVSHIVINHNYFGFNIETAEEINLHKLIVIDYETVKANMVNLYLQRNNDEYTLRFVDEDNIVSLPEAVFSIIDKKSREVLVSNISVVNGKATFNCDREISQDNVYIVNCLNQIVNKPKANLTFIKTGTDYEDTNLDVLLNNGSVPIGNENISIITTHFKGKYNHTMTTYKTTLSNGTLTVATYSSPYQESRFDGEISEYAYTVIFSNKDFGTTIQSINFTMDKVDTILILKSTTKTYNPTASQPKFMSPLQEITWTSPKYGKIKNGVLYYKIYKNNKQVYETPIYCNDEVKPQGAVPYAWDAGTYKIVVHAIENSIYKVPVKTATLKIKPAKATAKASKVSNKYKKSKYFKVTVKLNGKAVKKIKINLKIYTGKKSKNYIVKTDSKGIAKFNTKNLKIGKHKVVITSKNGNYAINAKSQITIKR